MIKKKHTKESLFDKTIPQVAKELELSEQQVYRAECSGLKKIKNAIIEDPRITQLIAHEADDKEITGIFKKYPWCLIVITWDGIIWPRNRWFNEQEIKNREYIVT